MTRRVIYYPVHCECANGCDKCHGTGKVSLPFEVREWRREQRTFKPSLRAILICGALAVITFFYLCVSLWPQILQWGTP